MILMDQIEEVAPELQNVKNESCIVLRMQALKVSVDIKWRCWRIQLFLVKDGKKEKVTLTNPDEIGLKEWLQSLRATHKKSQELLASMTGKVGKIYGTDSNNKNNQAIIPKSANGN